MNSSPNYDSGRLVNLRAAFMAFRSATNMMRPFPSELPDPAPRLFSEAP